MELEIGNKIFITGPIKSGKTTLAIDLMNRSHIDFDRVYYHCPFNPSSFINSLSDSLIDKVITVDTSLSVFIKRLTVLSSVLPANKGIVIIDDFMPYQSMMNCSTFYHLMTHAYDYNLVIIIISTIPISFSLSSGMLFDTILTRFSHSKTINYLEHKFGITSYINKSIKIPIPLDDYQFLGIKRILTNNHGVVFTVNPTTTLEELYASIVIHV